MSLPPAFTRLRRRPRVVGHRGVRRPDLPENTLSAFAAAIEEGAEALELDARPCATGELVVLHDPTLERVTGGLDLRAAADLSLAELTRVELPRGEHVPTLVEALTFARARGLPVNVELKHDVPSRRAIVQAAARLFGSWDRRHPILVSSFDPPILAALRALVPRVPIAMLVEPKWQRVTLPAIAPLGAAAVHLERTLTRPETIANLKARGYGVAVWTVNDPREARDLAELGVDAIITDDPATIRQALEGN